MIVKCQWNSETPIAQAKCSCAGNNLQYFVQQRNAQQDVVGDQKAQIDQETGEAEKEEKPKEKKAKS